MATLTEALAEEAEACMWLEARHDDTSFDLRHPPADFYDVDADGYDGFDDSMERAQGAYHNWSLALGAVADALAGQYGPPAADLLHHLVRHPQWAWESGCAHEHIVPEAAILTQAVFSPQHAYDRHGSAYGSHLS